MPKGTSRPRTAPFKPGPRGDKETRKKLQLFRASTVANRAGAAAMADGSIMRRAEAFGSRSSTDGQTRAKYGISKKEPVYSYGFSSSKLAGSVAKKPKKKK